MSSNLTKAKIENTPAPASGRLELRDERVPGLLLRVTAKGARSFYIRRRIHGAPRYIRLGGWPDMTIEQARRAAQRELSAIAEGRDPREERKAEQALRERKRAASVTLRQVFDEYKRSRRSDGKPRKESTVSDIESHLNRNFADWTNRAVTEITRDGVLARHRQIAERGAYQADQAMRYLRSLLNFARDRYTGPDGESVLPANPVDVLRGARAWHAPQRRRHVIARKKLGSVVNALEHIATDPAELGPAQASADLLLFLLFTGLRFGEAAPLLWEDVDTDSALLTIDDPKNRRPTTLPLSSEAAAVLERRGQATRDGAFVFPGRVTGHLSDTRGARGRVAKVAGGAFTNHDLRRTFISVAEALDIGEYTLKRLLNHAVSGADVTGGYVVPDLERLRSAAERVGQFIREQAIADSAENVVSIERAAAGGDDD